jgi:phosphoribosyl 1,2-cyclic phosphate phosphodiesterase
LSHFTLDEAIQMGQTLQVPSVYFTHISHQLGTHAAISQELPDGFYLAYDGLQLSH